MVYGEHPIHQSTSSEINASFSLRHLVTGPVVQVGRFISPYNQPNDQTHQIVVLTLSKDLAESSVNTGTVELTAIDGVSKTTTELTRLAEAHMKGLNLWSTWIPKCMSHRQA